MGKERLKNLKRKLLKYDVISFDIFDTLISRNVNVPQDVFRVMENYLIKQNRKYEGFAENRIGAEKEARKNCIKKEVTLDDIYSQLKNKTDYDIEVLKELECKVEEEVVYPNNDVKEILKYCLDNGKEVILCSDMYHSVETIQRLLQKCGITGYTRIYLSSQNQMVKWDGSFFKYYAQIYKLHDIKVIHIGDCFQSDYMMPKRFGISAYWYRNKKECDKENIAVQYMYQSIENNVDTREYWEKIGTNALGPFLYGYSKWLQQRFQKHQYEKIFYLSRDGFIVKKAMETIKDDETLRKGQYIYISRRSLIVPTLWIYKDYHEMCKCMFWKRHFTVRDFVENFGLEYEQYKNVLEDQINLKHEFYRQELFSNETLLKIFHSLYEDIVENSKREYGNVISYLRQNHFYGNVAIVDSGWHGNIQNALIRLCKCAKIEVNIDGYYIGVRSDSKYLNTQHMYGYLFQGKEGENVQVLEQKMNVIVEEFVSRDEGSVWKYESNQNEIKPVLYEIKKDREKIAYLQRLQHGAIRCVKMLDELQYLDMDTISPWDCFKGLYKIGINPRLKDAYKIGNFVERNSVAGGLYYIFHLKRIKTDILEAKWKIGFLKRLFLLNFNYFQVQKLLEKVVRER